jgi:hypothetical protein
VRHGHAPPRSADAEEKAIETRTRREGKREIEKQRTESAERLTSPVRRGTTVSVDGGEGEWRVIKATAKGITVALIGGHTTGPKFAGKSYLFRWDGKGFKRQGSYLTKPSANESLSESNDGIELSEDTAYLYDALRKAKAGWTNLAILTAGYRGRMTGGDWQSAAGALVKQGKAKIRKHGGAVQLMMAS